MNLLRIELLKKYISEDPTDPFNYYALALEYLPHEPTSALQMFSGLVRDHPDYLPCYYQYGRVLIDLGRDSEAMKVIVRGIELAIRLNEKKTLNELNTLFEDLA